MHAGLLAVAGLYYACSVFMESSVGGFFSSHEVFAVCAILCSVALCAPEVSKKLGVSLSRKISQIAVVFLMCQFGSILLRISEMAVQGYLACFTCFLVVQMGGLLVSSTEKKASVLSFLFSVSCGFFVVYNQNFSYPEAYIGFVFAAQTFIFIGALLFHGYRKQAKQVQAKAEFAAQMSALGTVTTGVSHEVNNALSTIWNSARLLQIKNPERKNLLKPIENACGRLSTVLRTLNKLSEQSKNTFSGQPVNDGIIKEFKKMVYKDIPQKSNGSKTSEKIERSA